MNSSSSPSSPSSVPLPPGYHAVTPYLTIKNAAAAIDFYKQAFGAREVSRYSAADGLVGHAEIQIGGSHIMVSDEFPEWGAVGPLTLGGTATSLMIYVADADAVFARAVALGAKELSPMKDEFYGDRCGKLLDPFGHKWMIATHREIVPPAELNRRATELFGMTYTGPGPEAST